MTHLVTSITRKTVTTAQFARDLPETSALRQQQVAVNALRQAAPGFNRRIVNVSPDGQQLSVTDVWADQASRRAFGSANTVLLDALNTALAQFNTAQANTVVTTSTDL